MKKYVLFLPLFILFLCTIGPDSSDTSGNTGTVDVFNTSSYEIDVVLEDRNHDGNNNSSKDIPTNDGVTLVVKKYSDSKLVLIITGGTQYQSLYVNFGDCYEVYNSASSWSIRKDN